MSEEEAKTECSRFSEWYGVIDGGHRQEALRRLSVLLPDRFSGFAWTVLLLNHATIPELRAFARSANEKQSSEFFIHTTVYDTLHSLQDDIELYKNSNSGIAPTPSQLAEFYSCRNTAIGTGTLKSLCRVALRLTPDVVHHIGVILNAEEPDTASAKSNKLVPVENLDCRIFRKLITANTLRLSKVFSRNGGSDVEKVQIDSLYRMRLHSTQNDYKPVPAKQMDEFYIAALGASIEVQKFEEILGDQKWPEEMLAIRQNMLRTSLFDSQIELNKNNPKVVFQPLLDRFRACCPNLADMKLRRWLTDTAENSESSTSSSPRPARETVSNESTARSTEEDATSSDPRTCSEMLDADLIGNSTENLQEDTLTDAQKASLASLQRKGEDLTRFGISAYNSTWDKYETENISAEHLRRFDMVLTEPPSDYNPICVPDFISFSKRMLLPGGCLFVILTWSQCFDWVAAARKNEFRVMDHPFIMCPDTSKTQRTRATAFTQRAAFPALVEFSPGEHPRSYKLDFQSEFLNSRCTHKRKFSVMENVPPPSFLLVHSGPRRAFVQNERSPILLSDILTTFCPPSGSVLDPFAGTLSMCFATLMTGRACTAVECDEELFRAAVDRLQNFTKSRMADGLQSQASKERSKLISDFFLSHCNSGSDHSEIQRTVTGIEDCSKRARLSSIFQDESTNSISRPKNETDENQSQCAVSGCILGPSAPATGHNCTKCQAPVHVLCCIKIHKQKIEEPEDPLFCTSCFHGF